MSSRISLLVSLLVLFTIVPRTSSADTVAKVCSIDNGVKTCLCPSGSTEMNTTIGATTVSTCHVNGSAPPSLDRRRLDALE